MRQHSATRRRRTRTCRAAVRLRRNGHTATATVIRGREETTMTEEQQRIRGYLVAQGAKLPPAAIVDRIQAAMAELGAAAMSVPAARWAERPEPKEWSGNEVMAHVLAADGYFGGGILAVLDDGPLPPRPKDQGA